MIPSFRIFASMKFIISIDMNHVKFIVPRRSYDVLTFYNSYNTHDGTKQVGINLVQV